MRDNNNIFWHIREIFAPVDVLNRVPQRLSESYSSCGNGRIVGRVRTVLGIPILSQDAEVKERKSYLKRRTFRSGVTGKVTSLL
ncbi:hypothetical protein FNYG_07100 [Fusarium nygamai]|uniref:Uncharacterized protein n=1 Tax=Gibberella nygamai TaxID=42673 RepID=A0A2K0WB24_GIBNY|nr:hypothetical protein FNYG_07100 [Fusarium nygamai]